MNQDYKTSVVESQEQSVSVIEELSQESLAQEALEDIHNTERLSGFGRFATKMQSFFQASAPSKTGQRSSHLKAAPIMMSAGLLLLLATGLVFLLSKPESAVHSHFRTATGLNGTDDRKPVDSASSSSSGDSPVTENQLAGGETNRDTEPASRVRTADRSGEDPVGRRFTFANGSGAVSGSRANCLHPGA